MDGAVLVVGVSILFGAESVAGVVMVDGPEDLVDGAADGALTLSGIHSGVADSVVGAVDSVAGAEASAVGAAGAEASAVGAAGAEASVVGVDGILTSQVIGILTDQFTMVVV